MNGQGCLGVDTDYQVTNQAIAGATALLGGAAPQFWGRYFTSVTAPTGSGDAEYAHANENPPLSAAGIRVLPIARQTGNVGGSASLGNADGTANAADIFASFGAAYLAGLPGASFYVFLDVEPSPVLSSDYYSGWAQGLSSYAANTYPAGTPGATVNLLPCIYSNRGNAAGWTALNTAIAAGAPCHAAWVAAYPSPTPSTPPAWSAGETTPVSPSLPSTCPIVLRQYAGDVQAPAPNQVLEYDLDQSNPVVSPNQFLANLILPPSGPTPTS